MQRIIDGFNITVIIDFVGMVCFILLLCFGNNDNLNYCTSKNHDKIFNLPNKNMGAYIKKNYNEIKNGDI